MSVMLQSSFSLSNLSCNVDNGDENFSIYGLKSLPQNGEWTFPKMATGDHERPILLYHLYPKYQKLLQHANHIRQPNHHVPNTF
jgi:hypothetical protein